MLAPVVLLCFLCSLRKDLRPIGVSAVSEGAEVASGDEMRRLEVGGESLHLDELGPIILNEDGTMRRIANWHLLTDKEREVTQRKISTRNKERAEAIRRRAETQEWATDMNNDEHEGEEILFLPESVHEAPLSPVHGGDGSDESTSPPENPSTTEGEHFPPRSMF